MEGMEGISSFTCRAEAGVVRGKAGLHRTILLSKQLEGRKREEIEEKEGEISRWGGEEKEDEENIETGHISFCF